MQNEMDFYDHYNEFEYIHDYVKLMKYYISGILFIKISIKSSIMFLYYIISQHITKFIGFFSF